MNARMAVRADSPSWQVSSPGRWGRIRFSSLRGGAGRLGARRAEFHGVRHVPRVLSRVHEGRWTTGKTSLDVRAHDARFDHPYQREEGIHMLKRSLIVLAAACFAVVGLVSASSAHTSSSGTFK